jgi:hypothetical protein
LKGDFATNTAVHAAHQAHFVEIAARISSGNYGLCGQQRTVQQPTMLHNDVPGSQTQQEGRPWVAPAQQHSLQQLLSLVDA